MSSSDLSSLSKAQKNSLAVSYAVLILSDSNKEITAEHLTSLLKSTKLDVITILISRLTALSCPLSPPPSKDKT